LLFKRSISRAAGCWGGLLRPQVRCWPTSAGPLRVRDAWTRRVELPRTSSE
jgi:hypothetical protein